MTDTNVRSALLQATLKLFAEGGTQGASTRRIAQEAGVNEVTLFRHFGTKEDLICAALRSFGEAERPESLPAEPADARAELLGWCLRHHGRLYQVRALIRTSIAEFERNRERVKPTLEHARCVGDEMRDYLARLRDRGLAHGSWDAASAASMLLGTLFSDAIGRDAMPERYPHPPETAVMHYVDLFLAAIGAAPATV